MELRSALIVGVGSGLSASLARLFAKNGLQVALASRNPDRLAALAHETAATTFACEAAEPEEVGGLFDAVIATQGVPDVVVYNASATCRPFFANSRASEALRPLPTPTIRADRKSMADSFDLSVPGTRGRVSWVG